MKNTAIKLTATEKQESVNICLKQILESDLPEDQKKAMIDNLKSLSEFMGK